jgi:hypothetical protein
VAGGPAALEAAVEDVAVAAGGGGRDDGAFERRGAARAVGGADVEVGEPALEEVGDARADRMGVVEDRDAVAGAHPVELGGERGVVGRVEGGEAAAVAAASGSAPCVQIGRPSKSVTGQRPVVLRPG